MEELSPLLPLPLAESLIVTRELLEGKVIWGASRQANEAIHSACNSGAGLSAT